MDTTRHQQELLSMYMQQIRAASLFLPIIPGIIKAYYPESNTVDVMIYPAGILIPDQPLLTPWAGQGYGMQAGPPTTNMQVFMLVLDSEYTTFACLPAMYNKVDKPPGAPAGEFWVTHESVGTYIKLANDKIMHIGGHSQVEVMAPQITFGDLLKNLSQTKNGVVRQSDLQAAVDELKSLINNYNGHQHPTPNGPSGPPLTPESPPAQATSSSVTWSK